MRLHFDIDTDPHGANARIRWWAIVLAWIAIILSELGAIIVLAGAVLRVTWDMS